MITICEVFVSVWSLQQMAVKLQFKKTDKRELLKCLP